MKLPVEDLFEDVVAKAQKGLGVTHRQLAAGLDLPLEAVRKMGEGSLPPAALAPLAEALRLSRPGLERHHQGRWEAPAVELGAVRMFSEPFFEGVVNAYAVPTSEGDLVFDTGLEGRELSRFLRERERAPTALFLTHLHRDHTGGLGALIEAFPGLRVFVPEGEAGAPAGARPVARASRWGAIEVEARPTPGHSPGGTTYVFQGGEAPVAVVGDALFAGSVDGCAGAYETALKAIREQILSLPSETLLLPGHGPVTTVGHERRWNPFFP
jgi:hydroxyacylglutathione hydrolase